MILYATCAKSNLRVKSRAGHHIELINKLAEITGNNDIKLFGHEIRSKRNKDLYDGGTLISDKEAKDILKWTEEIFIASDKFFQKQNKLL